jgi:SAM-dependent methyltransferase
VVSRLGALRAKLRQSLRRRGLFATIIYSIPFLRRRERIPEDLARKYGYSATSSEVMGAEIESPYREHIRRYLPTAPWRFNEILGGLAIPHERFTFVDVGSGKGLALLMASEFPFRKIVGIEISPQLWREAASNLRRLTPAMQKCVNIESVCADAIEYPIPDGPVVFYLYNPFDAELLGRLLARIQASYEARPRDIYMIYNNPDVAEIVDNHALLRQIRTRKARWGESLNVEYSIYKIESTPP